MIPLSKINEISAARNDRQAIVTQDLIITWREFGHYVSKIINKLIEFNENNELNTICFVSPNRYELILLSAAAATLKITFVGLDYSQSSENIVKMIDSANCDLLVISSAFFSEEGLDIKNISRGLPVIDLDNRHYDASNFNSFIDSVALSNPAIPDRPFRSVSFTSGTSGVPKLVLRNKSFDGRRFSYFTSRFGFNSEDRHLLAMPLYHAAGGGWARLFLYLGATLVIAPPNNPREIAKLLRSEWITTSAITPPLLNSAINYADKMNIDLTPNKLRFVLVGGKHFSKEDKLASIKMLGPVVYEYYGSTETGVNTIATPHDLMTNPLSVGRPYDGNDIKVLDSSNRPLPSGVIGRVAVASYMNMDGYNIHSENNKVIINGSKYLITSETGRLDDDGRLFLMNRSQGSSQLDLYAMENEVKGIQDVLDVAVIPSKVNSQSVSCAVVLKSTDNAKLDSIKDGIIECFRSNKIKVEQISILDEIPYSPTGKVRMDKLLEKMNGPELSIEHPRPVDPEKNNLSAKKRGAGYFLGILLLLITAVSWGAMFPITKHALYTLDAVHITLIRYGAASIIFLFLLGLKEGWASLWPGRQVLKLLLFGSLGFAGFSILAFAGLAYTKAQHGAIIMSLMPLISAIMVWILQRKKPENFTILCILAAFLGVVLVVTQGKVEALSGGALIPSLSILAGAFCWVTYTIGAGYINNFSVLRYTALSAALGTLTIVAISLVSNQIGWTSSPTLRTIIQVRWELLYLVLIAGVMAVFSWNAGIKIMGPVNGVLFINLVPITAFIIGYVQGKSFNNSEIIGAGITIAALFLNNFYTRGWFFSKNRNRFPSRAIVE